MHRCSREADDSTRSSSCSTRCGAAEPGRVTSQERIEPGSLTVRPAQHPRPPILLAAYTAARLDRIARRADGRLPANLPFDAIAAGWTTIRDGAAAAGRDPHALELIVRAAPTFSDAALGPTRAPFTGSWRQIADDIAHTRDLGAHELIIDLQAQATRPDELVDTALELAAGVITTIVARQHPPRRRQGANHYDHRTTRRAHPTAITLAAGAPAAASAAQRRPGELATRRQSACAGRCRGRGGRSYGVVVVAEPTATAPVGGYGGGPPADQVHDDV